MKHPNLVFVYYYVTEQHDYCVLGTCSTCQNSFLFIFNAVIYCCIFDSSLQCDSDDSVDRTALWQLLFGIGLPHQIVALFKALYTDTVSCVRADGSESEWFPVFSGVRQGS